MMPTDILKMTVRVSLALSVIAILSVGLVRAQLDPRISLTPSEDNWLKEHPVIRLGIDPNAPPTEYVDGDGTIFRNSFEHRSVGEWATRNRISRGEGVDLASSVGEGKES